MGAFRTHLFEADLDDGAFFVEGKEMFDAVAVGGEFFFFKAKIKSSNKDSVGQLHWRSDLWE